MPDHEATLVARIKTLYSNRVRDKLVMQKAMAELRDKYDYTQRRITEATGVPQSTVDRWLRSYDQGLTQLGQASRLTPKEIQDRSEHTIAKRVLANATPEQVRDLLDQPNVIPKVTAATFALSPQRVDIRSEAEKKADEAESEEFRTRFTALARRGPVTRIESAVDDVKWFIENDKEMPDGDYAKSVAAFMELGHELWVFGAQHGYDASQLAHEIERWQEMLDGEEGE